MNAVLVFRALFFFILYKINMNSVVAEDSLDSHPNLKLLPDNCGERIVLFKKVSNKNDVFTNQFPFIAVIMANKENPYANCLGALINENYVLTSAKCVETSNTFAVRLGEHNFETEVDCDQDIDQSGERSCNDPVQEILIENITNHKDYNLEFKNNIALVRLAQPANLTRNNVRTICLPVTSELRNTNYEIGQIATFSTNKDYEFVELKRAFIHVITERKQCDSVYLWNDVYLNLKNKYLCGHIDKINGADGRAGAPLFQLKKIGNHEKYLQFGFWIGIPELNLEGLINEKGGILFLNVSEYMQWILDNLKP